MLAKLVLMKPFLKQVADHYYISGEMRELCFVFPNRRSMIFFRKYLCEAVAASAATPVLLPPMTTINDFFYKASGVQPGDRVRLLLKLYDAYSRLNPKAESLDEFIFCGDVILSDFNDVDKYLVDPRQLFANVADYKALQDTFEYLSETQRKAIEGFLSHFNDQSGKLTVKLDSDNPDVKSRFLQIWNILYPLYEDYNRQLKEDGMAYEGMVYRSLAGKLTEEAAEEVLGGIYDGVKKYVFVGLNALNECEKLLLRKLRDASMAEFCWDWSGDMIRDAQNRSSFFMSDNVKEFPQAAQWDGEAFSKPQINVLSVASSVGQAKRLPDILKSRVGKLEETAVVLPDENLLRPVLNSIPEDIQDINVTMGLPMSGSLFYSLMTDISSLQLHLAFGKGRWLFYHKQIWSIFSSGIFKRAADEQTKEVMERVKKDAKYYLSGEELSGTPLLDAIFRPVITDPKLTSKQQIFQFSEYQKEVIKAIAPAISADKSLELELVYAKEYYKSINILQEIGLEVLPLTYIRLLSQLLACVSVPFKGEPLKGLQIMGPLETRALDFRTLVIMSANEGVFPRRNVSSSFVPPELRRGFGLPTYEYQDAVWAYYFYRMISRAEQVWMLVDSRTEGLKSGEESRYIKQLEYHFGLPLKRYVVKFGNMRTASMPEIEKTAEDVEKIKNTSLSATTLQNYLACPAKFYFATIKELELEDEVAESLDYGMFGTVYHDTMRALYTAPKAMAPDFLFRYGEPLPFTPMERVSRSYIDSWLKRPDDIKLKVKALIIDQLKAIEVRGRDLVMVDVIVRYVLKTLRRDLELLTKEDSDNFEILGLENRVTGEFRGQKFKGFIDRLDSFRPGQIRVVDYKTGKVLDDDENIFDENAEAVADKIFAHDVKDRPKIALQFYIYDMLLLQKKGLTGMNIYNSVYSTAHLFKDAPQFIPMNLKFFDAVSERLEKLLDEMYNVNIPFRRTEDEKNCGYCDFKMICGR